MTVIKPSCCNKLNKLFNLFKPKNFKEATALGAIALTAVASSGAAVAGIVCYSGFKWFRSASGNAVNLSSTEYRASQVQNPTTLLLIHGASSTKATWDCVIDPFKQHYNIVAIDIRGHGESPIGNEDFSIPQMVKDVEQVVKAKKLKKFVIIGHSMGVRIAVPYAAKHPEKVQALVLEDCHVLPRQRDIITGKEIEHLKTFKSVHETEEGVRTELTKYKLGDRFNNWLSDGRIKLLPNKKFKIFNHPYVNYLAQYHISGSDATQVAFQNIKNIPILLLRAEKYSCVTDEGLAQMQKMQPNMKYIFIDNSEHSIHKTHTRVFVDTVNEFIQKEVSKS